MRFPFGCISKRPDILMDILLRIVFTWYFITRNEIHFCQNDRYEIDTRNEFQTHMRIKRNIQRVCAYSFRFGQILFTWKSHAGLDFHFGQNDRYEIHIVLSFISPQFMWTQIKSWLKTEVRFSTKWNLITVWIHFASHVNVVLIQHAEAVVQRCSVKRCPYTIRKIHRKTLELETLAQMFSCEFCKIYKNTFCYRTHLVAASEHARFHLRPTVSYFSRRLAANNNAILMLICF